MILEEKIIDGPSEQKALEKSRVANFKSLGYKFFEADDELLNKPIKLIKETLQQSKFSLPSPYDEILLNFEFAPIYWVTSSRLIQRLENYIKATASKEFVLDYFNYTKEFYFKWVIVDTPVDKKYFAISALKALKHTEQNNFILNTILHTTILIYEKSLYDKETAENQMKKALSLVQSLNIEESYKNELNYILNIFNGFLFLKLSDVEGAIEKFTEANRIKPDGVNSIFYLALSHARLNNFETTENLIRKVYDLDQNRIALAIKKNHRVMFSNFVHKPMVSYFFEFNEFSNIIEIFSTIKERNEKIASVELNQLRLRITKLKELSISDYMDENILESFNFLDNILQFFKGTGNVHFLGASNIYVSKFQGIVECIKDLIKIEVDSEIREELKVYSKSIDESKNELQRLKVELVQLREKIKIRLAEKSDKTLKMIAAKVSEVELEIQNLDIVKIYNHKLTFNNSIIYSLIISFILFMIGGLAGYANSNSINAWDFKSVMSIVFTEGLKWSAVSIFIGTIISFSLSASTLLKKSNRKLQLMREVGVVKNSKQSELENLKLMSEERQNIIEERYERRIKEYQKRTEDLEDQKQVEESALRKSMMGKYLKLDEQLAALLN